MTNAEVRRRPASRIRRASEQRDIHHRATMSAVLNINSMATTSEKTPGWEEQILAYERSRGQKHPPDHLTSLEILVLRQVVKDRCIEEHTLRSRIGRTSLSRALSRLTELHLVRTTIDISDRRRRILYSTRQGEKRLAELDLEHRQTAPQVPQPADAGPAANELSPATADANSDPVPAKSVTRRPRPGPRFRRGLRQPKHGPGQLSLEIPEPTQQDPNLTPSANEPTPLSNAATAEDPRTAK